MRAGRGLLLAGLLLAGVLLAAACGSRGPLDIGLVYGGDAGDASLADAAADGAADAPADVAADGAGDGATDAAPEAGVVQCATCVAQNCGTQVVTCLADMACRAALTCVTQKCLTGGNVDPQCFGMCTNNDPAQLAQLFAIFQCVLTSCGVQCAGALGGFGGGGGGGTGDGG